MTTALDIAIPLPDMTSDIIANDIFTVERSEGPGDQILILSLREALPEICRGLIFEHEDVLHSMFDSTLVSPRAIFSPKSLLEKGMRRILKQRSRSQWRSAAAAAGLLSKRYSMLIVCCQSLYDFEMMGGASILLEQADRSVCLVAEVWKKNIEDYRRGTETLREFTRVYNQCLLSVDSMAEQLDAPVAYNPPAVDLMRFTPAETSPEKRIDMYWMGRRAPTTHKQLLEFARSQDFFYLYDTFAPESTVDHRSHRRLIAEIIRRSRYFWTNPAKSELQQQTGGQQEIGYRFFEGAAAGAAIIGQAPNSPAWEDYFGWKDSILPFPYEADGLANYLHELEGDPERVARAGLRNGTNALRRHDWAHRWREIYRSLNIAVPNQIMERIATLEDLASKMDPDV